MADSANSRGARRKRHAQEQSEREDLDARRDGKPYPRAKRRSSQRRPDCPPMSLIKNTKFKNSRLIAKVGV
jgi:hypothetical protein